MRRTYRLSLLSCLLALTACKGKEEPNASKDSVTVEPWNGSGAATTPAPAPTNGPVVVEEHDPEEPLIAEAKRAEAAGTAELTELTVGARYGILESTEVVVMNPSPIDDGAWRFEKGSTCRIDPYAIVTAVAEHETDVEGGRIVEYLVRYRREPTPTPLKSRSSLLDDYPPYECPDGTVFFLDDLSTLIEAEDEPDPRFEIARKLLQDEPLPRGKIKVHR
jgi:hypothetical protein